MFDAVAVWKYAGVVGALIAAGFGAPIPEEIPIVTAGAMVGHDANDVAYHDVVAGALGGGYLFHNPPPPSGTVRWWIMLPLITLGVVASDTLLYLVGRRYGTRLLNVRWVQRRILPADKRAEIEANFHKNGILILLGARLTPGIRTPVFLMAGVLKLPVRRFLLADSLYAVPGVNFLFWLAYLFTDQFVAAIHAVERHRSQAAVAVLAAVAGVVVYRFAVSRRLSTGDVDAIPAINKPAAVVAQRVEEVAERAVGAANKVVQKVAHPHPSAKPESDGSAV
jgi:membrane protein DedA with SNARE-associated domain